MGQPGTMDKTYMHAYMRPRTNSLTNRASTTVVGCTAAQAAVSVLGRTAVSVSVASVSAHYQRIACTAESWPRAAPWILSRSRVQVESHIPVRPLSCISSCYQYHLRLHDCTHLSRRALYARGLHRSGGTAHCRGGPACAGIVNAGLSLLLGEGALP